MMKLSSLWVLTFCLFFPWNGSISVVTKSNGTKTETNQNLLLRRYRESLFVYSVWFFAASRKSQALARYASWVLHPVDWDKFFVTVTVNSSQCKYFLFWVYSRKEDACAWVSLCQIGLNNEKYSCLNLDNFDQKILWPTDVVMWEHQDEARSLVNSDTLSLNTNTIQYNFIAKCRYTDCTRNVLWCQVHSSHIHSNHKTFNYNNSK